MNRNPLVSIITPFYNTSPVFMEEAIQSVFSQTCDNWELILSDDGSGHESTSLAKRYASRYPRQIRYCRHVGHRHWGTSASRQSGIRRAQGVYITFLDADDVLEPEKLAEQVEILEGQPEAAMLYGNSLYWYSWSKEGEARRNDFIPRLGVETGVLIQPPELLPLFLSGKAAVPCMNSLMVRRHLLETIGGFQEEFQGMYDDQVLYAKICLHAPVIVSAACWDKYRQHPCSLSKDAQRKGRDRTTRLAYLDWLARYLAEKNMQDRWLRQALNRELWYLDEPAFLSRSASCSKACRRLKKWFLAIEERVLPAPVRRGFWHKAPDRYFKGNRSEVQGDCEIKPKPSRKA